MCGSNDTLDMPLTDAVLRLANADPEGFKTLINSLDPEDFETLVELVLLEGLGVI
jgi:hypothetical protein